MYPNNNQNMNYSKPSPYNHSRNQTATKSPQKRAVQRTYDFTPTRFTKKPSERLSQLKNSINKCIQQLSNKKQVNRDALKQVNDVNRQVLEHLSNSSSNNQGKSIRQTTTRQVTNRSEYGANLNNYNRYNNGNNYREDVVLSTFNINQLNQNISPHTLYTPAALPYTPASYTPMNYSYNTPHPPAQQFQHSQVNQVPFAQSMVSQYQMQSLLTNQRAHNQYLNQRLLSLTQQQQQLQRNSQNISNNDHALREQNQMLRYQLGQLNHNSYINVYEELQKIKDDNEKLRKDTIHLLQNKKC